MVNKHQQKAEHLKQILHERDSKLLKHNKETFKAAHEHSVMPTSQCTLKNIRYFTNHSRQSKKNAGHENAGLKIDGQTFTGRKMHDKNFSNENADGMKQLLSSIANCPISSHPSTVQRFCLSSVSVSASRLCTSQDGK
jgi:hypothetical protein